MKVAFSENGWTDYLFWQKTDKKILKRVNLLIEDIKRNPSDSDGIGKPEKLKENLSGYYSRRITSEHRLVYKIFDDFVIVAQCRFHY
ncbi:toxin-antitoxin system, toxin component, Txe/YoeB family [Thiovulum sp. ES]|nr:toxin-antitoxin system, toxin component, Txe/YoeB family [Thiovulum sp. ES]